MYTTCTWTEKKSRSAGVYVYTFKNSKIMTVHRNAEFISEIICTFVLSVFYDKSMLKRQFLISLGIMDITNYTCVIKP